MLRCEYVGGRSYTSAALGLLFPGAVLVRPKVFVNLHIPKKYFSIRKQSSWCVKWPGLGDKIYLLPSLYNYSGKIGVVEEDMYIFRVAQDKVRALNDRDVCCVEPAVFSAMEKNYKTDLTEAFASVIDSSLGLKLPILQTTSIEKKQNLKETPNRYVVVCERAADQKRDWKGLKGIVASVTNLSVLEITERNKKLFSLIEKADLVVSVNTSVVPIAGGFQVPLIAVSKKGSWGKGVLKYRVSQFLETEVMDSPHEENVKEKVVEVLGRSRLKCWCGETEGEERIVENLYVIECKKCGTLRQNVKLSGVGLDVFYKDIYQQWRQVLEGEDAYEDRIPHDILISRMRLRQWGQIQGKSWFDVGSGNGALISVLREQGWDAVGLEKRKVKYPAVEWAEAKRYDVISFIDVLEHLLNPEREIIRAREHLEPEGIIIIELPNAFEEPKHFRRLQHLFFFTDKTFKELASFCGLRVVRRIVPFRGRMAYILKEKV